MKKEISISKIKRESGKIALLYCIPIFMITAVVVLFFTFASPHIWGISAGSNLFLRRSFIVIFPIIIFILPLIFYFYGYLSKRVHVKYIHECIESKEHIIKFIYRQIERYDEVIKNNIIFEIDYFEKKLKELVDDHSDDKNFIIGYATDLIEKMKKIRGNITQKELDVFDDIELDISLNNSVEKIENLIMDYISLTNQTIEEQKEKSNIFLKEQISSYEKLGEMIKNQKLNEIEEYKNSITKYKEHLELLKNN